MTNLRVVEIKAFVPAKDFELSSNASTPATSSSSAHRGANPSFHRICEKNRAGR